MADIISQEVNIDMIEKLPDGTYKIKYPKTIPAQVVNLIDTIKANALYEIVTGNGTFPIVFTSTITLGFRPKFVIIGVLNNSSNKFSLVMPTTITDTGFTYNNGSDTTNSPYRYYAFK